MNERRELAIAALTDEQRYLYDMIRISGAERNAKVLKHPISDETLLELIRRRALAFAAMRNAENNACDAKARADAAELAWEVARIMFEVAEAPVIDELWRRGMTAKT